MILKKIYAAIVVSCCTVHFGSLYGDVFGIAGSTVGKELIETVNKDKSNQDFVK